MIGEVDEVLPVQGEQRQPMADAAGSNPSVVLRSRATTLLGPRREGSPSSGNIDVEGQRGPPAYPGVEPRTSWLTPISNFGPFPEFSNRDEREPHTRSDHVAEDPVRRSILLQYRSDVGVDHDVGVGLQDSDVLRAERRSTRKASSSSSDSQTSASNSRLSLIACAPCRAISWSMDNEIAPGAGASEGCSLTFTSIESPASVWLGVEMLPDGQIRSSA